jgi:hypothetical protein
MWQLQFIAIHDDVSKIEEVDVDLAGNVARMIGCAAKRFLNLS